MKRALRRVDLNDVLIVCGMLAAAVAAWLVDLWLLVLIAGLLLATIGMMRSR